MMLGIENNRSNGAAGREAQRAVGERSFVAGGRAAPAGVPDPELVERAKRRRFTAEYKLRILREADACSRPGEVGALLRREGLYTSHLTYWRKQRDVGEGKRGCGDSGDQGVGGAETLPRYA
jgi:hypothetical protein